VEAVLEELRKCEDLIVCSGVSTEKFQLSSLFVKSCCGYDTGTVRVPRERGMSIVGIRYQRIGEETADCEDLMRSVLTCRV
jgi:hypothetical protein